MPDDTVLSPAERAELEQLRAEVATLRSQVAAAPAVTEPPPVVVPAAASAAVAFGGRHLADRDRLHTGAALVVAVWTKNLVTDTDRYVATVAPLASDPAIQSAVADKITAEIFARLDVVGVTNQAVDALAERGLPPLVANQLHSLLSRWRMASRASCAMRLGRSWRATHSSTHG